MISKYKSNIIEALAILTVFSIVAYISYNIGYKKGYHDMQPVPIESRIN